MQWIKFINNYRTYLLSLILVMYLLLNSCTNIKNTKDLLLNYQNKKQINNLQKTQFINKEGDDCIVYSFIDISNNKKLVLKRTKILDLEEQILLIFDYTANSIANHPNINIPVPQENYLINKKFITQQFCKDQYYARLALLQSLVSGVMVSENSYNNVDIHQRSKKYEHIYGKLKIEDTGLTRNIIQSMSQHEDLIKIVAFDTFINNSDRSNPNIIYDQNNNRYYGIDHMAAFADRNLSAHALRQISSFADHLNKKEKATLRLYKKILEKLYNHFPPIETIQIINNSLDKYCPKYKANKFASEKINKIYNNIKKNYIDTKKLLDYLENI